MRSLLLAFSLSLVAQAALPAASAAPARPPTRPAASSAPKPAVANAWRALIGAFRVQGLDAQPRAAAAPSSQLGNLVPICEAVQAEVGAVQRGESLPGDSLARYADRCPGGAMTPTAPIAADIAANPEMLQLYKAGYQGLLIRELPDYARYVAERVFALSKTPPSEAEAAELFYQYGCRRISRVMPGFAKVEKKIVRPGIDMIGGWDEPISPEALTPPKPPRAGAAGGPPPYQPKPKEEVIEVCTVTHPQLERTLKRDLRLVASATRPGRAANAEEVPVLSAVAGGRLPPPKVSVEIGVDRPGRDYQGVEIPARGLGDVVDGLVTVVATMGRCMDACKTEAQCKAYTFVVGASGRPGKCWLKRAEGTKSPADDCISGTKRGTTLSLEPKFNRAGGDYRNFDIPPFVNPADAAAIASAKPADCAALCARDERCRAYTYVKPGLHGDRAHCYLKGEGTAPVQRGDCCVSGAKEGNKDEFKDLGFYDPRMAGETFNDISKRLITFYRKSGSTRNFTLSMEKSSGKIAGLADRAPPQAQAEMRQQAAPVAVATRNRREVLRRQVERWTYGYEYEQLSRSLGGQLRKDYGESETVAFREFWSDCEELQALCQSPKTSREREACLSCARQAAQNHCLDGREDGAAQGQCKGGEAVTYVDLSSATPTKRELNTYKRHTFLNWVSMKLVQEASMAGVYQGRVVSDRARFVPFLVRNLVDRIFLPDKVEEEKGKTQAGKRLLDSLPITAWQRCMLWNPFQGQPGFENLCDGQDAGDIEQLKAKVKGRPLDWSKALIFKLVLAEKSVESEVSKFNARWIQLCAQKKQVPKNFGETFLSWFGKEGSKTVDAIPCDDLAKAAEATADQQLRANAGDKLGMNRDDGLSKAGDAIGSALGPIVGKLLGMLLRASGMYEMMKTLARAAGLTPEQSVDCEDQEYRRDVMKIPACPPGTSGFTCQDTKRGCLLKVFAKNFTSVLESIIVMLGDKLVDWGVDLIRTALQAVKSALLASAGSVPFAGGFLATLVDIGWELIMNFGAKMLLKSFVVAKLPVWLKVRELASLPMDKLMDHPIVAAVAGVIIELVESAVTQGDKGWMAVGVDSALSTLQTILQNTVPQPDWFWLRALTYAKKDLREKSGGGSEDLGAQLRGVAQSMIRGFGQAVGRRIDDPSVRSRFDKAVDDIAKLLDGAEFERIKTQLLSDPVKALTGIIGQKLGPVIMPVITSLVPMEPWAKELLLKLGDGLSATLTDISRGQVQAKDVVKRIVEAADPAVKMALDKLPISDAPLKRLITDSYDGLSGALKDIDSIQTRYLQQPWNIVKGLADLSGDFLKAKLGELVSDPALEPEKTLLVGTLDTLLGVLSDERQRTRLFPGGSPDGQAILSRVGELLRPYLPARLRSLLAGTGLEELAASAAEALVGPTGPFVRGAAFFTELPARLQTQAGSIVGQLVDALSSIVQRQAERLGVGPMVGGLVRGVFSGLGRVLRGEGGLAGFLRQGAAGVLGLVKDAFSPLLAQLATAGGEALRPLTTLASEVLGGLLDLFANPASVSQLAERGVAALGELARRVGGSVQTAVKSLLARVLPDPELRSLADGAVDGLFGLLADPAQLARFSGENAVNLLKEVGGRLFTFARGKLTAALAQLPGLAQGSPAQGFVTAGVDAVTLLLNEPARLRTLVSGGASGLVSFVATTFQAPVRTLLGQAVPEGVRAVVGDIFTQVMGYFTDPSRLTSLGTLSAQTLIQRFAPVGKSLLESVLRTVLPADVFARVGEALNVVQAALANPAGLVQQALTAAREAIDNVVAAALMRISDGGLRELASGVVSVLRDLVTGEGAGASLRTRMGALAERLVDVAGRYLIGLLPAGPAQTLARAAMDGLRSLFSGTGEVAATLAQQAQALLPRVVRTIGGLLREGLAGAIPDRALGGFVQSVLDEVLGFVAEPARWQELMRGGVGAVLSRVFPLVRDLASGLLGRLPSGSEALRSVVEGLLGSLQRLFASPESVANLAQNAVGSLVSLAVDSVGPAVVDLVERSTGSAAIAGFLRTSLTSLAGVISQPARLQAFLRSAPQQALTTLLGEARGLVERLLGDVVKDEGLRGLAQQGATAVLDLIPALAQGGASVGQSVQQLIGRLLTPAAALARSKLLGLFPGNLAALRDVVGRVFDKLTTTATQLVTQGSASWSQLTSGAPQLLGSAVEAILPLIKEPITRSVGYLPLRGLLTRLLDGVANLLKDPAALVRSFRDGRTAMRTLLPELGKVVGPFLDEVIVQPIPAGIPRDVVAQLVATGRRFLDQPDTLDSFLQRVRGDYRTVLRAMITEFKPALLRSVPSEALKTLLGTGLDLLMSQALGGGTPAAAGR